MKSTPIVLIVSKKNASPYRTFTSAWLAGRRSILFWMLAVVGAGTVFLGRLVTATAIPVSSLSFRPSFGFVSTKSSQVISTMESNHQDSVDPNVVRLTITSMNVAGCVPSAEAPRDWTKETVTHAIREELLRTDADVLALQECPGWNHGMEWASQVFGSFGYHVIGSTPSHADNVILLVRRQGTNVVLQATQVPLSRDIPAVMAELEVLPLSSSSSSSSPTIFDDNGDASTTWKLLVASVHLAPFKEGARERLAQIRSLVQKAQFQIKNKNNFLPLVIVGDTNMRVTEDKTMEGHLGLLDAWKWAGSNPFTRFTWDTIDHQSQQQQQRGRGRPHSEHAYYNRYYGDGTRQYNARYDRMYLYPNQEVQHQAAGSHASVQWGISNFQLVANHPIGDSRTHFLSDHFGLSAQVSLSWS